MKGIFDQYGKVSKEKKVKMILNVILENWMSVLSIPLIFHSITLYSQQLNEMPWKQSEHQVVWRRKVDAHNTTKQNKKIVETTKNI
jgi:hypothetical protein